jgi:hypothetical protein
MTMSVDESADGRHAVSVNRQHPGYTRGAGCEGGDPPASYCERSAIDDCAIADDYSGVRDEKILSGKSLRSRGSPAQNDQSEHDKSFHLRNPSSFCSVKPT